jgi:3-phosphoshikimate 1-carboxyvinyltransferase
VTRDPWPAPFASTRIDASVCLPGSKSLTARYLVLAALADSPSHLSGALISRDTQLMIAGLAALGARIDVDDAGPHPSAQGTDPLGRPPLPGTDQSGHGPGLTVAPAPIAGPARIETGLAGTVMRFLPPVAALAREPVEFDGDPAARRRPMGPLIEALRALGVRVEDDGRGRLPFAVHGIGGVEHHCVGVDASASSQFLSALLLAAPALGGLDVTAPGPVPSAPHVQMTLAALRQFGAHAEPIPNGWRVGGRLGGRDVRIEPDLSNAAPFLAAGVVTAGRVTAVDWPSTTVQPGDLLREFLAAMGADVSWTPDGLTVLGPDRPRGVDLDLGAAGELAPTLAAIAAVATTPSRLTGIGHLRGHETDRLAALTREINRLGGRARELPDGLEIVPAPLHGGAVETYGDHRMATFAAVIGLVVPGVTIRDVATTAKTLPDFPERWTAMVNGPW